MPVKFTRALLVCCVLPLVFAGCQFIPGVQESEQEAVVADSGADTAAPAEEVVVRRPNPYMANRSSISAAAQRRFEQANQAIAEQRWQDAEKHLLWLTQNYDTLSGPFLNLALLYRATEQFDKVEPAFKQALAANTNNINAYNQYAIYLRERGEFAGAELLYRQALGVWPDHPESHLNLAILYDLYMGKLAPALQHYQDYQELQDEPDRQVQGWIVDTQRRIKAQQPQQASIDE